MFTGIVEHAGRVVSVRKAGAKTVLRVSLGPVAKGCRAGDSISVAGTCLTLTGTYDRRREFRFQRIVTASVTAPAY